MAQQIKVVKDVRLTNYKALKIIKARLDGYYASLNNIHIQSCETESTETCYDLEDALDSLESVILSLDDAILNMQQTTEDRMNNKELEFEL